MSVEFISNLVERDGKLYWLDKDGNEYDVPFCAEQQLKAIRQGAKMSFDKIVRESSQPVEEGTMLYSEWVRDKQDRLYIAMQISIGGSIARKINIGYVDLQTGEIGRPYAGVKPPRNLRQWGELWL